MNVGIAALKARLSEHLRRVRRGETVTVFDRDTPVARLVPYASRAALVVRPPRAGSRPPGRVPLPRPLKLDLDVVDLLLEDRHDR